MPLPRRALPFASAFVLAAVVSLASAPALAQPTKPTVEEELPAALQPQWRAALRLMEKNCPGAIEELRRIYDKTRHPIALYNVGICYRDLRRYTLALESWERVLAEHKGSALLPAEREQAVSAAIAAVRPFIAYVTVTANEPDAVLVVKGEEVGKTPFKGPVPVDIGEQTITLRKPGFKDKALRVALGAGETKAIDFQLEPGEQKSLVRIDVSGAPGATLLVDGVDVGPAPFKGRVTAGRHTFEARAPGFEPTRKTEEVVPGEPLDVSLTLARTRSEGKLRVSVLEHPDAVIEVDGRVVGQGAFAGVLRAGGHQIAVRKKGYEVYQSDFTIAKDQTRSMRVSLSRDKGVGWVYFTVGGAALTVAGVVAAAFLLQPGGQTVVSGTLNAQNGGSTFTTSFPR